MEPECISHYELGQMLIADNAKKWNSTYSELNKFSGSKLCACELIEKGLVRMVVKLKGRGVFWAVKGHIRDEAELAEVEAFQIPAGMYVSANDDSGCEDELSFHTYIYSHDGNPLTLVDDIKNMPINENGEISRNPPWCEPKEVIIGYRNIAQSFFRLRVIDGWRQVYRDDVLDMLIKPASVLTDDGIHVLERMMRKRLSHIFLKEAIKYTKQEQEWKGQRVCKARLDKYSYATDANLSANEIEVLTKMLTDLFSERGKNSK